MEKNEPLTKFHAQKRWSRDAIKQFAFKPPPRAAAHVVSRAQKAAGSHRASTTHAAGLPATADITAVPEILQPRRRFHANGQSVRPLTVYPPDGRSVFKDTTYPWRACGLVTTNAGRGAGALVGPRHVLTASHLVGWTNTDAGLAAFPT